LHSGWLSSSFVWGRARIPWFFSPTGTVRPCRKKRRRRLRRIRSSHPKERSCVGGWHSPFSFRQVPPSRLSLPVDGYWSSIWSGIFHLSLRLTGLVLRQVVVGTTLRALGGVGLSHSLVFCRCTFSVSVVSKRRVFVLVSERLAGALGTNCALLAAAMCRTVVPSYACGGLSMCAYACRTRKKQKGAARKGPDTQKSGSEHLHTHHTTNPQA